MEKKEEQLKVQGENSFVHPVSKKEISVPQTITIKDGKEGEKTLTFFQQKKSGWSTGGWYKDDSGNEYMVKFEEPNPFLQKLSNDLLVICVGKDFAAENNLIGLCEFNGEIQSCFVTQKIPGYENLKLTKEEKALAEELHLAFVFLALIAFDDTNPENMGVGKDGHVKLIDFGNIPHFLNDVQFKFSNTPFHLASLIGHRNAKGMQYIRNFYFGYDGFLNPLEREKWPLILGPEDISYYDVLSGVKKIIEKKDDILAAISNSIKAISNSIEELESANLVKEKKLKYKEKLIKYEKELIRFDEAIKGRIASMEQNFSKDLEKLEQNKEEFSNLKWRLHPYFLELMKKEQEIFGGCIKKSCKANFEEIAKKIGLDAEEEKEVKEEEEKEEITEKEKQKIRQEKIREKILKHEITITDDEKKDLKEYIDKNFVLHNFVMNNDLEMVKWILENNLADINKSRNDRSHNYQYFRLNPLHIAISIYYDDLVYNNMEGSDSSHEMIEFLKGEFFKKNGGDKYQDNKAYEGDDFAIKLTFRAIDTYDERSSIIEEGLKKNPKQSVQEPNQEKLKETKEQSNLFK
jgi:hypothetical protein